VNYLSINEVVSVLNLKDAVELRKLVFEGRIQRPMKVFGWSEGYILKLSKGDTENGN
jgi:hypothetical protein